MQGITACEPFLVVRGCMPCAPGVVYTNCCEHCPWGPPTLQGSIRLWLWCYSTWGTRSPLLSYLSGREWTAHSNPRTKVLYTASTIATKFLQCNGWQAVARGPVRQWPHPHAPDAYINRWLLDCPSARNWCVAIPTHVDKSECHQLNLLLWPGWDTKVGPSSYSSEPESGCMD